MKTVNVYFVAEATCVGSGSDPYRSVVGLPRKGSDERKVLESADIVLVTSNTGYAGELVKEVKFIKGRTAHRTAPPELRFRKFKPGMQRIKIQECVQ